MEQALNPNTQEGRHRPTALYPILGSLVSLLLGYDLGIISFALDPLQKFFNLQDWQLELLVGGFGFIGAFATPLAAITSDYFGRRRALAVSCAVATVGSVLMAFAPNYATLMAGRAVT